MKPQLSAICPYLVQNRNVFGRIQRRAQNVDINDDSNDTKSNFDTLESVYPFLTLMIWKERD